MRHYIVSAVYKDVNKVVLFGRSEDNSRFEREISGVKPYFYVQGDGGYISIKGEKLRKIEVNTPLDVVRERGNYEKTYEADIEYVERNLIDRGIYKWVDDNIAPVEEFRVNLRKNYIDIEADDSKGIKSIEQGKSEIYLIGFYDTYANIYTILTTKKPRLEVLLDKLEFYNVKVLDFKNETAMLSAYVYYLKSKNAPDVNLGWNIEQFDIPALTNRCKFLKIDFDFNRFVNFDLDDGYARLHENGVKSLALDYVAKEELGYGKIERRKSVKEMYNESIEDLIVYNIRDIKTTVEIDRKLGIFDYFKELSDKVGSLHINRYNSGYLIDSLILRLLRNTNIRLPSKGNNEKQKEKGAEVFDAMKGFYENVLEEDNSKTYPSLMYSFNISPDTIVHEKGDNVTWIEEMNVGFKKEPLGIFPKVVKELMEYRDILKYKMTHTIDETERKSLNNKQTVVKEITNSFYGIFGDNSGRFYDPDIQGTITYLARNLIKIARDTLTKENMTVLYGDTDSVFFTHESFKGKSLQELLSIAEDFRKKINKAYDDYIASFNLKNRGVQIKVEAIYKWWLSVGVKKKYVGRLMYDGRETNEVLARGFSLRRSDASEYTKKKQAELFEKVIDMGRDAIKTWFKKEEEAWAKHSIDIEDICLLSSVDKDLSSYAVNTPFVKGIKNSREPIDTTVGKVKLYFLIDGEYCVQFDKSLPKDLVAKIDWNHHKMRCFDSPFDGIKDVFHLNEDLLSVIKNVLDRNMKK